MNCEDIWLPVVNYEGLYEISSMGRVRSLDRLKKNKGEYILKGKILKVHLLKSGYYSIRLTKNGKGSLKLIHQLVAQSFLNHTPNGHILVVNHKDFNRLNNIVENLEITTTRNNCNRKHLKSTSKYVGVSYYKNIGKFVSQIRINGKLKYLGAFENEIDASNAYQKALIKINEI